MAGRDPIKVLVVEAGQEYATLRELPPDVAAWQQIVGGWVEDLALAPDLCLYMNEDGRMAGLPVNGAATRIVYIANPGLHHADYIVGNVILFGVEPDPDTGGMRETDVPEVARLFCQMAGVPVRDEAQAS